MSQSAPNDTPLDNYATNPPPKPRDGKCQICRRWVGIRGLRREHCHLCGLVRGWACDDCNLPYTEHIQENWLVWRDFFELHICDPDAKLFDFPATPKPIRDQSPTSRPLRLSNGGGDDRSVNVSSVKGYFTIEQVAVMCGVNTATARDHFNGRRGLARQAKRTDNGAYLVPVEEALALVEDRIRKGLQ